MPKNRAMVWNQNVLCYCEMSGESFGFPSLRHIHCNKCNVPVFFPGFVYRSGSRSMRKRIYYCLSCWDAMWR